MEKIDGLGGWSLHPEDAGLGDLRRGALHRIMGVLLVVAFSLFLLTAIYIAQIDVTPAYVALALAALVGIVARCSRYGARVSSAMLVAGLVGIVAVCVILWPSAPVAAALCVPVLIATVLLGSVTGTITLLAGSIAVTYTALAFTPASTANVLILTIGLGGLLLVCSVVLWRSFYTVLDWSWASYEEAQKRTAELRKRQGELARLNQSLILAYEQIKQTSGQLERARQAAEGARRLKSEFAASVSHELRTPLNLIIGLSELMVVAPHPGMPSLPDIYCADIEAIYRNACHISNLIDDVLDLSQIEAHHMGLLKEHVSLTEIVALATTTVQTLFENTGLSLDVQLPDPPPMLFVDPVRIRQILINLLNNAVRFTEEGGVTVSARAENGQMVIDVIDTGTGIPPQDLPGVFQEFWRSGEPRRGRRGSGLGLAVSKRFAELHGGNMWVTSTVGRGSTFTLALPLGEKSVVQEAELAEPYWARLEQQTSPSPALVLVAPEPEVLRVFQRYLDGYQVMVARDAPSAARLADEAAVSAILVGTTARRDTVRRALHQTAGSHAGSRLPIITCGLRTSRTFSRQLGVLDYLTKPLTQQQLRRTLRRFGGGLRDLVIVDDDPEMLHLLSRMVTVLAPRCRLRTGTDGWQALDLVTETPPDGLLLDLLMPGLDGYGVLARMKQEPRLAGIPVAVISARGAEDEGLTAETLEISQLGGLPAGELCRWIRAGLDCHHRPQHLPREVVAPGVPAGPSASPAYSESR